MDKLEVLNLHKEYEGQPLLDGVSFQVEAGETLCLLGSSGSGKSTILRIIAGIETPGTGQVRWNGDDLTALPVYKRNFGLMFQDYALFPHLNVFDNVAFGLRMRRLPQSQIRSIVHQALESVNMMAFSDRSVTDLSGGEQQRIALARALAPSPRLLMLDEPLAALDRSLRVELQAELRDLLHHTGIPAIYVTHDQEEAILLGDRLALLHEGRIVQSGATEDLYNFPETRWVAGFLGMTGFLPGTVTALDPLTVRTGCGDLHPLPVPAAPRPALGEQVMLLVKSVDLDANGDVPVNETIRGRVESVTFLGDHYRITISLCADAKLELVSPHPLTVGKYINIPLAEGDLLLLRSE